MKFELTHSERNRLADNALVISEQYGRALEDTGSRPSERAMSGVEQRRWGEIAAALRHTKALNVSEK